jgi:hypothetical protein
VGEPMNCMDRLQPGTYDGAQDPDEEYFRESRESR